MDFVRANNINDAYYQGLHYLLRFGVGEDCRNGPVIVAPTPMITEFREPWNRVLFSEARDANPFFHLMESMWMLAGRKDVDFVAQFVPRMREYSDDGYSIYGAYGWRWRNQWRDQLPIVVDMLRDDPTTRRAVLTMWGVREDLGYPGRDVPCNTHIYFGIRHGELQMTVCNRSNDIIWGLYGANAVHLSFLHEWIASCVGVRMGRYYHISNNYHLYPNNIPLTKLEEERPRDWYLEHPRHAHFPIVYDGEDTEAVLGDVEAFCEDPRGNYDSLFVDGVVAPMYRAWDTRNLDACNKIAASDWRDAAKQWIIRRMK